MDSSNEMKALLKQCRLTYADAASLLGGSIETIRGWLKPATSKAHRPVPDGVLDLLRFLAESKFDLAAKCDPTAPGDLIDTYRSGRASSLAPDALADLIARIHSPGARYRDATEAVEAARRLLSVASAGTVLRILMMAQVDENVAYGYVTGSSTIALLTPSARPEVQIEFMREVKLPGRTLVEAAPVVYSFIAPILQWSIDVGADIKDCITVDGKQPDRTALPWLEDAYAVMVAHVLIGKGIQL